MKKALKITGITLAALVGLVLIIAGVAIAMVTSSGRLTKMVKHYAPQFPRRRSRAPPVPASQAALRTKLGKQPPGAGMCQADAAVGAPAAPWGRDMPESPMWWHLEETLEHQIGGAE